MAPSKTEPTSTFRADLVPTWAKITAWAAVATTVPSITWRMTTAINGAVTGDNPCINPTVTPLWEWIYVTTVLPCAQLGTALLTIGLIRPWGEVFPRWIPGLGGRRVPISFGIGVATAGALALAALISVSAFSESEPLRPLPPGCEPPGWEVGVYYLPMVLWPLLLLAVTWHYYRRRTHHVEGNPK